VNEKSQQNPRLVSGATEKLRDLILEYEGLLTVKLGPGGGYYGIRPDNATLERTFATYMRVHNIGYRDAFEMTVSLDCDIAETAAGSEDDAL
jgi:GntR family transcriptional regulator, transcriptional repressor for pyruvate dehydrogenase complex